MTGEVNVFFWSLNVWVFLSFAVLYASLKRSIKARVSPLLQWQVRVEDGTSCSDTPYSVCLKGIELSYEVKMLILWMSHVVGHTVLTEIDQNTLKFCMWNYITIMLALKSQTPLTSLFFLLLKIYLSIHVQLFCTFVFYLGHRSMCSENALALFGEELYYPLHCCVLPS